MDQPLTFDAPRPVKLTVDDFAVLHRAGAFDHYRRAELIDGGITEMSPLSTRHALVTFRLSMNLHQAFAKHPSGMIVIGTATVALPPHDAPEPDILVGRDSDEDYAARQDVALIIEVAVSTLRYDLMVKRDLYAQGGVPEYWVVDVDGGRVHQFWSPVDGAYTETRDVPLAGELRSLTMSDLAIDGSGIL